MPTKVCRLQVSAIIYYAKQLTYIVSAVINMSKILFYSASLILYCVNGDGMNRVVDIYTILIYIFF